MPDLGDGPFEEPGKAKKRDEANAAASTDIELVVSCGIAFQRAGDARARPLQQRLERMQPRPGPALVQVYAAAGELDRAIALLTTLKAQNNVPPNLAIDPLFDTLRTDPRYTRLMNP